MDSSECKLVDVLRERQTTSPHKTYKPSIVFFFSDLINPSFMYLNRSFRSHVLEKQTTRLRDSNYP